MRSGALITLLGLLCLSAPAQVFAKDTPSAPSLKSVSVRPIARSSTDLFEVLTQFIKAEQAFKAADYRQSLKLYRTVLLHDSEHIQARLGLGHSALELGYNDLAADIFARFSNEELSPSQQRALIIGQSLSRRARISESDVEAKLKAALNNYPDAPRLWTALGDNYVQAKDYNQAASAYNKARALGYSGAKYAYKFGLMNLAQQKYTKASAQFKTAARLDPEQPSYDHHYRLAHLLSGDYISALEHMPADRAGEILGQTGQMAIKRGEYELARLCLKKALEVSPSYHVQAAQDLAALQTRLP